MASVFEDATKVGSGRRQLLPPQASATPGSRIDSCLPGKENETGTAVLTDEQSENINGANLQVSPSLEPSVDIIKQDNDSYENKNRDSDTSVNRNSQWKDYTSSQVEGVFRSSSSSSKPSSGEQELWQKLENLMAAKQSHVQQVLEEFGIADVQPSSDELEEQVWKVVEGELTMQEAADLV